MSKVSLNMKMKKDEILIKIMASCYKGKKSSKKFIKKYKSLNVPIFRKLQIKINADSSLSFMFYMFQTVKKFKGT